MGAQLNTMEVDGKASREEVVMQFNTRCEQDGYEMGHSYSGSFSQFAGLSFTNKHFYTEQEAYDYIDVNGEKWGPAVAVKYTAIEPSKRLIAHNKAIMALSQKIHDARYKLRNANEKMRINNRKDKPAYVVKAEAAFERVKKSIEPKIADRKLQRNKTETTLAAKSKDVRWLMGGWCSS